MKKLNTQILILVFPLLIACKGNLKGDRRPVSPMDSTSEVSTEKTVGDMDRFLGTWNYLYWENDSSLANEAFDIELKKTSDNKVEGLWSSVMYNGNRIDGWDGDHETEVNVRGELKHDTLFLRMTGSYREGSYANAILTYRNDTSLYFRVLNSNQEIYLPIRVVLSRENTKE